jgi:hypothetical protein
MAHSPAVLLLSSLGADTRQTSINPLLTDPSNIESGISAQDEWWQRLQQMIDAADVIVFVVSPDSAASKVCDEEIAYARNLGKRIIPILCRSIDFAKAPGRLAALNVKISFIEDGGATFSTALDRLCAELDVDVGWHRESRRLVQLAVKWGTEGRSADQLMNSAFASWSHKEFRLFVSVPQRRIIVGFGSILRQDTNGQEARARQKCIVVAGIRPDIGGAEEFRLAYRSGL